MEISGEEDQLAAMLKSVEDFQKIKRPEIKDLSSLLIPFIKFYIENKRLEKVENDIDELAADVHNLKLEIANSKIQLEDLNRKISEGLETLNNNIKSATEKMIDLEASSKKTMSSINVLLQSRIDNDVIIRGFTGKIESQMVCDNFIKYFNLDPSEVVSH
jgi:chromosome segregation ATPase